MLSSNGNNKNLHVYSNVVNNSENRFKYRKLTNEDIYFQCDENIQIKIIKKGS